MFKPLVLTLTLLATTIFGTKIDFSLPNEPILNDPYYGMQVGDVQEYIKRLNETEKYSDFANNSRMEVRNTRPGSIQDSYYNAMVASTTYCTDKQLADWSCKSCNKLGRRLQVYKVIDEPKFKTRAIIYLDSTNKQIVLAFRGTVNLINWFKNFQVIKTKFPIVEGGEVHHGIKDMADKLHLLLNPEIENLRNDIQYKEYEIVVVGHSLGGALALFAAIYLQNDQQNLSWDKIQTFTYGQPRIGNKEFSRWLNSRNTMITRVVHASDVVPHSPPMFTGFSHQFTEIYVKGDKAFVCDQEYLEDSRCSNSNIPFLSWNDHLSVWDIELGIGSC